MCEPDHDHVVVMCPASVEAALPHQPVVKVLALEEILRPPILVLPVSSIGIRWRRHSRLIRLHLHPRDLLLHTLQQNENKINLFNYTTVFFVALELFNLCVLLRISREVKTLFSHISIWSVVSVTLATSILDCVVISCSLEFNRPGQVQGIAVRPSMAWDRPA